VMGVPGRIILRPPKVAQQAAAMEMSDAQ